MAEVQDLRERLRLLEAGELTPMAPRPAATVAIVRDGSDGLEVYLLRRVRAMSFAAGMHVFPGGSVDASDAEVALGSVGDWPERFGVEESLVRPVVVAAVRETFEEAGVLLAAGPDGEVVADAGAEVWEGEREAVEGRRTTFAAVLERHELTLRTDLLAPLAHWVTPELEPRRFDTYFFVAALPAGQHCREAGTEADARVWVRPAEALATDLAMMPPTRAALTDLARFEDVAAALSQPRDLTVVRPHFELVDGELTLVRPPA